jgi:CheY-like chemotaxis protein
MMKVLVVEDDETLRDIYALKLSLEGFEVETASDGQDALERVGKAKPDLIILDIMMPRLDGLQFLRLYGAGGKPRAKVLVASNKTLRPEIEEAKRLGASDYLIKSQVTPDQLVEQVRKHLNTDEAS